MPVFSRETVGLIGKDTEIVVVPLKSSNHIYQIFVFYGVGCQSLKTRMSPTKLYPRDASGLFIPK